MKKQKRVEGLGNGGNVDIISKLPDSLLQHILSLLPTDLAVSTCILSKRWKDLWMSTTNLDFNSKESIIRRDRWPKERICLFIRQVLLYHASSITRFNLICLDDFNATLVESWLSAAAQRQVQEISLSFKWFKVSFPICLCTSKNLRVLKVEARDLEVESDSNLCLPPSTIWFQSLKILHLNSVRFMDDLSFARLLSGLCIEELVIDRCQWDDTKNVVISLPTLRRLTFHNNRLDNKEDCVVNINAKNLLNLNCIMDLSADCILDTMPLLAHAKVYVRGVRGFGANAKVVQRAINLFGAVCYAKSLHIAPESLWCLGSCCASESINLVPMFVSLTTLRVESEFRNIQKKDSVISRSAAAFLRTIFQNAPLLESLVIAAEVRGGKWSRKPHPHCIEFSLKKCSLLRFRGRRADILFLKFLLKTSTILEELKIHCHSSLRHRERNFMDIKNMLQSVQRASKCCVVEYLENQY